MTIFLSIIKFNFEISINRIIIFCIFIIKTIWLLGITFLLTGGELVFSERFAKKNEMLNPINVKTALIMGCGQACGVLPGLSRSGTTITAGTIAKVDNTNSILRITPCDNIYIFPPGVILNMFKYIELNLNS